MTSNGAKSRRTGHGNDPNAIFKRLSQISAILPSGGFKSVNEILDYAIACEKESYDFYIKLMKLAEKPDVRSAFESFATDELRHAARLQAVRSGRIKLKGEDVGSLGIAEKTPSADIRPDMRYVDALKLAMNKEKIAFRLYTKLAALFADEEVKQIFSLLAQEEARHKLGLELEYDLTTF
jgi:rubrerythrin